MTVGAFVLSLGGRPAFGALKAESVMSNPFATAEMAAGYAAARPPVHPRVVEQYFAQRGETHVGHGGQSWVWRRASTRAVQPYATRVIGLEPVVMMVRLAETDGARCGVRRGRRRSAALVINPSISITAAGSLNYVRDLDQCFDEMRRVLGRMVRARLRLRGGPARRRRR